MAFLGCSVLALIPARGGSVGVPGKNLALCAGRPLVEHTLQAAIDASVIDQVFLSSDTPDLLRIGERMGVYAVRRPAHLASAEAGPESVVRHFLEFVETSGTAAAGEDPFLVYLQPTSPLRTSAHIDAAFAAMGAAGCRGVVSVCELDVSPRKMFEADSAGRLKAVFDEKESNRRRQDLPRAFLPNGAIYAFASSDFIARGGFPTVGSHPFVMSDDESIDIDTQEDLERAEARLRKRHG